MKVRRTSSTTFELSVHAYELATLMAAVKWAVEGGQGELSPEARAQLRSVVAAYEAELARELAEPKT